MQQVSVIIRKRTLVSYLRRLTQYHHHCRFCFASCLQEEESPKIVTVRQPFGITGDCRLTFFFSGRLDFFASSSSFTISDFTAGFLNASTLSASLGAFDSPFTY